MKFHVLTLFPEMIEQCCAASILGRAQSKGQISVSATNIRDYAENKHGHVDDYPYGGGAGMVMQAGPICRAFDAVTSGIEGEKHPRVIYVTPQGQVFSQKMAQELAREEDLVILCGHYEGVDERALIQIGAEPVSIGDYVLTGGELPALGMIDAIARLVPGVLNNSESAEDESFSDGLLEYPQYTRPEVFRGEAVPEVLLSGHHANIAKWRREQSLIRTGERRPDLLESADLSSKEKRFLQEYMTRDSENT